jgi:hypothetical protein
MNSRVRQRRSRLANAGSQMLEVSVKNGRRLRFSQGWIAARSSPTAPWPRAMVSLAALAMLGGIAVTGQQPQQQQQQAAPNAIPHSHSILLSEANRLPDANDLMESREKQTATRDYAAANAERKKQIADDSAKLFKLAIDLNAEVARTSKETLSLDVIRKADEMERLAHSVKEKMRLSVGGG